MPADQYWLKPKRIHNGNENSPRGWWYANHRGFVEIYSGNGTPIGKIRASEIREYINMLDHHKPEKKRAR